MVVLDHDGVIIKDMDGNILDKKVNIIDWTSDMAEKGGLQTFHVERNT